MRRPTAPATVPLVTGWRAVVVSRRGRDYQIGLECSHRHAYKDTAENCAGRAYRRWWRTGEKPQ